MREVPQNNTNQQDQQIFYVAEGKAVS